MKVRFLALCLFAAGTQGGVALTLHVAPNGNDGWSGRIATPREGGGDGPLMTLVGARDAVRKAREAGESGEMHVIIGDGEYLFGEPLVLEPRDSGIVFEAAAGARPVFAGGRRVTGFTVGEDGHWTVKIPEPGGGKAVFEMLWVNGRRATRARTPNIGYIQAVGQPMQALPGVPLAGDAGRTMLQIAPGDAAILRELSSEELREVNAVVLHSWNETRHRIAGVRVEDGTLQFTGGSRAFFSLEPFHRLYLENVRAALDEAGEWFLARDGMLSYKPRPGEKPETAEAWMPVAMQWVVFKGDPAGEDTIVRDVQFRRLSFRYQGYVLPEEGVGFNQAEALLGAAITADGARNVIFEDCEFGHTATNAVWIRRGCRDVTLRKCRLHDLGAGGVKIGEPALPAGRDQTSHITVDNCIIHTGGRYFLSAIGVLIFHASDCRIRHCDIADFFYSAISIGWVWGYKPTPGARNLVENCHLHHLGWGVLSDMGAVYTLGPQPGTVIRGCHIHDIGCASYGGWGMYNDEGSTGIVWENNLVHHTQSAGYHQHYGRGNLVRNNIIAFGVDEHVRRSKPEEFIAFAFERNIVLMGDGRLFAHVDKNWDDGRVWLAGNVYWKPAGAIPDFAGKTWADWQFMGRDNTSVVADPLFIAPEEGDWTLRPGSPALKLGFVPFDWKGAGVKGDEAWRRLAAREFPSMKFGMKPKAPPLQWNDGFEGTAPGGKPARAKVGKMDGGHIAVVAGQSSKGGRCLQLSDGPEIEPAFEPHFYYEPHHDGGTSRVAFDVKPEPGYRLIHEWRDSAQPYRTGPMLQFEKGAVSVPGRKLADLPPGGWVHVEVVAKVGPGSDATWSCTLTPPGGEPQHFDGLRFVNAGMGELRWIGFSSPGKEGAKCWLDEIVIENKGGH